MTQKQYACMLQMAFSPKYFNMLLVESMHAEPLDIEGQVLS